MFLSRSAMCPTTLVLLLIYCINITVYLSASQMVHSSRGFILRMTLWTVTYLGIEIGRYLFKFSQLIYPRYCAYIRHKYTTKFKCDTIFTGEQTADYTLHLILYNSFTLSIFSAKFEKKIFEKIHCYWLLL